MDLADLQSAKPLSEAPVPQAILAVGASPGDGSFFRGEIAVMSPAGQWRLIPAETVGLGPSELLDAAFLLSPDGKRLAIGGLRNLVVVHIGSGRVSQVPMPRHALTPVSWTRDSRAVLLSAGSINRHGWSLDVHTGQPERRRAVWYGSVGPNGEVREVLQSEATRGEPSHSTSWDRMADADGDNEVRLSRLVRGRPKVAHYFNTLLGVTVYRDAPFTRALLAIDPDTGAVRGRLPAERKYVSYMSAEGQADDWLIVSVVGPAKDRRGLEASLVAWDPLGQQLRVLIRNQPGAQHVSVALDLLEESS